MIHILALDWRGSKADEGMSWNDRPQEKASPMVSFEGIPSRFILNTLEGVTKTFKWKREVFFSIEKNPIGAENEIGYPWSYLLT